MEEVDCQEVYYSEQYADYIFDARGNIQNFKKIYQPDCLQRVDENFFVMFKDIAKDGEVSFEKYGYATVPKCFGLLDTSSIEATGALKLRRRENFQLDGSGVLVGFVDTGIDFRHPLFRREDGSSRVRYIWDQGKIGDETQDIFYGREYGPEEIADALTSQRPLDKVSGDEESYHGTFMAAIVAGGEDKENGFTGMVPGAEIIMVKLKQAKKIYRSYYGIEDGVACYQENDIMMGIQYLVEKARKLRKPIAILIGMGTNQGGHNGYTPLGEMINRVGSENGVCIVGAAGNENGLGHHSFEVLEGEAEKEVGLYVEKDRNLSLEIWTDSIGALSVEIISPDGERSGRLPIRNFEQRVEFVFRTTRVYVFYERVEYYSGEEVICIRMQELDEGIWRIRVQNLDEDKTSFHIWLPMRQFVQASRFLEPNEDTIICNPGNSNQMLTIGGYDHITGGIYVNSSRGFRENQGVKPDLVAAAVEVYGPVSALRFARRSGSCIGAAHGTGAAAMLLEWGIVRQNNLGINTITMKNYLIRGARRDKLIIPSKEFGWGILDIFNTFESLKNY